MATSKQEKNHTTEYQAPRPACEWLDFDTALDKRSWDDDGSSDAEDQPPSDREEGEDWLDDDFHPSTLAEARAIETRQAGKAKGKGAKGGKGGGTTGKGSGKGGKAGSSRGSSGRSAAAEDDDPFAEYASYGVDDQVAEDEEYDDDEGVAAARRRSSTAHARAPAAAVVAEPPAKRARVEEARPAPMAEPAPVSPDAAGGVWERKESRSQPGLYYYWHKVTGENQLEPPPPWEKRESNSQPGSFYYWNPRTGQSSLEKPEV